MVTEPTDPTVGVSPSQGPWSQLNNRTENSTTWADSDQPFFNFFNIISLVVVLICLCGAVGNGAVVWLLGFCLKRSPFSVYILNLACADGTYLLSTGVRVTLYLLNYGIKVTDKFMPLLQMCPYLAGLGLLMAVSTERCISVLCPLWHRCHRPVHLSCTVCALIWGLALCAGLYDLLCSVLQCQRLTYMYDAMVVITFLVLSVSSLTLLVRVHCSSQQSRPSRLYVSILLTILAFLVLTLPFSIQYLFSLVNPYLMASFSGLLLMNNAVNPVIYFFVGRYRQRPGRTPLREVLQRALSDVEGGSGQRDTQVSTYTMTST